MSPGSPAGPSRPGKAGTRRECRSTCGVSALYVFSACARASTNPASTSVSNPVRSSGPVAALDRDWAAAAGTTTSVHDFLSAVGGALRPAMTRSAGLMLAAYDAAGTDSALRELADQLSAQRAATVAWIIDGVRSRAALREGVTRQHAIDQVWLLIDPAVYHRLTRYRGWSPARYEKWLTDTIIRLLLD